MAVAEHQSFSAAARSLHTVQSNVSTHVARLEKELDVVLVDRATTTLTPEGSLVVERARRIDNELSAMQTDVAALQDVIAGTVRLGIIGTTARWLIPPLVDFLDEHHPQLRLVVLDATTSSLTVRLLAGSVDLAVVALPLDEIDLSVEPLFDEDRILVAPSAHPLAAKSSVALEDLAGHELLLEAEGSPFRRELEEEARRAGVTLTAKAECDGMRLLASLAFSGFGAAILPASAAPGWIGGDWKRIPVTGLSTREVAVARSRRSLPSAADRAVTDALRAVVAENTSSQPGVRSSV